MSYTSGDVRHFEGWGTVIYTDDGSPIALVIEDSWEEVIDTAIHQEEMSRIARTKGEVA